MMSEEKKVTIGKEEYVTRVSKSGTAHLFHVGMNRALCQFTILDHEPGQHLTDCRWCWEYAQTRAA